MKNSPGTSHGSLRTFSWAPFGRALALLLVAATQMNAQEEKPTAGGVTLSVSAVQAQIEGIKKSDTLPAETRDAVIEAYESAAKELSRLQERSKQSESNRQLIERAPRELEEVERRLRELPEAPTPPSQSASLEELRTRLATVQAESTKSRRTLDELTDRLERRPKLLAELPQTIEALQDRIRELQTELNTPPASTDEPEVVDARQVLVEARLIAMQADLEFAQLERQVMQNLGNLFQRRRDLEARRLGLLEREEAAIEDRIRTVEETRQRELAKKALMAAASADPRIQAVIAENRLIAAQYNNTDFFRKRQIHTAKRVEETTALLDKVRADADRTRRRLEIAGNNQVVSSMMRAARESLPDPRLWHRRALWAGEAANETALLKIEIDEGLDRLADLDQAIIDILGKPETTPPSRERRAQEEILRGHLQTQKDLYLAAASEFDILLNNLSEYDSKSRELIKEVLEYDQFIAERILWVASMPPLGRADISMLGEAALDLIDPTRWLHAWDVVSKDSFKHPGIYILLAAGFVVSIVTRPWMRKRMREMGERVSRDYVGTPQLTAMALLGTILIAGLWPAGMYLLGHQILKSTAKFEVLALGTALQKTAILMFLVEFIKQACRPSGLAGAHFRWRPASVAVLRRNLHWLAFIVVPVAFVTMLLRSDIATPARSSMVRALFMVDMLVLAFFLSRILRSKEGVAEHLMGGTSSGWTARLRIVWYPALVILPVGLAGMAAFGFLDSAILLNEFLFKTLGLCVAVVIGNAFLLRWLHAVRGQLALRESKRRKEMDAADASSTPSEAMPDMSVDLSAVNAQTRRMLGMVVALAMTIGVYVIWSDIIPAFHVLDRFTFWSKTEFVWEAQFDADTSTTHLARIEKTTPVTLGTFVVVLLVGFVTVAAARNVPGFLEITLLAKLPLDAGIRFAISTVARYIISVVGLMVASGQLGIRWDSIQWLAAAFTVGLGFGLQEIVANFVSGLILLVERPFRIGDIVTVGEVHGKITRIQMRATTVTDWNRKELIVPNKEFITGQFVNWTLSDRILRLEFPVGIAYDSDTAHATRILREIAMTHPHVLRDPMPRVLFHDFGDSTLNFMLWAFVDNIDNSLDVRHEINTAILREFAAAGINIDYPQRDVNVRFVPQSGSLEEAIKGAIPIELPKRQSA